MLQYFYVAFLILLMLSHYKEIFLVLFEILIVILNDEKFSNNGVFGWHHSDTKDTV